MSVAGALFLLVGLDPVPEKHKQIAVKYAVHHLNDQGKGKLKSGGAFGSRKVKGNYGNMGKTCLLQGLSQEGNVVGGSASAAGLSKEESDLIEIVFSRKKSVHKLTYYQNCGVTGVVMNVFKSRFGDMTSRGLKKLGLIAVLVEGCENYLEMHREHIGD